MVSMVSLGVSSLLPPCRFPVLKRLDEHQWMRTGKLVSCSQSSIAVLNTLPLHLSKATITRFATKTLDSYYSIQASSEFPCMFCNDNSEIGSSCTRVIIGYWIGPDPEDGWGFVEGFLNGI